MQKEALIQSISQKKRDPRNTKWEYLVILDTLQEFDSCTVSGLLKTITAKYPCEPPLFTYSQLYSHILILLKENVLSINSLTKKYSVRPEYITLNEQVKYLPISNYCVGMFSISLIGLVAALLFNTRVSEASLLVVVGAIYLFCQLIGSEYDMEGRKETAVIVNGAKAIHQKIVDITTPQKDA